MTEITANGEGSVRVRAPLAEVFALLLDVPRVGMFWPGVERIEPLGEDRYRWTNTPRRAVGKTFVTEYVAQYHHNGRDEVAFESVAGNTQTQGRWRLADDGATTTVQVKITSCVDIPIPRLMKKPAQLFANREISSGLAKQLAEIKRALET